MHDYPAPPATENRAGFVGLDSLLEPKMIASISAIHELRPSSFDPLDGVLMGGFAPEELIVVAGRPGIGKSVTIVQWARSLAAAGRRVVLASYEHSELVVMAHLLLIELGEVSPSAIETVTARHAVDDLIAGRRSWGEMLRADMSLSEAEARLREYSENIAVLDRVGRSEGIAALETSVAEWDAEVLVVDHLQKVAHRAGRTAVQCKELAVATKATVIAASVVTDIGIGSRRLRPEHLVDAAAITHESDIEILLNDKLQIVSRNHSAFDSVRAESFRSKVVFSIEKNRRGLSGVDLEFERDFAHRRFKTKGAFVAERLVDNVSVHE